MAPRRTPLSRDRVLRAGLDLVDREGVDALTMRRLGRELGVEAMSLYGYVDSKSDLIEGVVEQVFRQMPLIVPGPGLWQDRLRRHASAYRSVLLDHPNAVRLVAGRPLTTEGTAAFVDSALAELQSIGLDLAVADRVLGVIAAFTLGHVSEEVGDEVRADPEAPRPQIRESVDPGRFPRLAAVGEMKPTDYDQEFELGMDFIVAGLEQLLAEGRGTTTASGAARRGDAGRDGTRSDDPRSGDLDDGTGYDKVIG
jgi:TetR/AcrR family transcriptional regulator, tetracycline repressor protein